MSNTTIEHADKLELGCLGAGRMGRGIAHAAIHAGYNIHLFDVKQRSADEFEALKNTVISEISASMQMVYELASFDLDLLDPLLTQVTIVPLSEAEHILPNIDIIFEAVPEVLAAKSDAFSLFDQYAGDQAILASTTSTMLSTELSELTRYPDRFLNAHWLNPAFLVPLVEISPANETSRNTLKTIIDFLEALGKVPVVCKASPGYIVPRIQALAMNEAARLVEEGVASAEDVDKAVKFGFGMRFAVLGLLEFIDWGGGDTLFHASNYLQDAFNDKRFSAPEIVKKNMNENAIGVKSGKGFFDYSSMDTKSYQREKLGAFLKAVKDAGLLSKPELNQK